MMHRWPRAVLSLLTSAVVAGCGADYDEYDMGAQDATEVEDDLGVARQAASACLGDDVNYDFNAFAASLAVAIANELERWDVSGDFQVVNGKLELSAMGLQRCNGRCGNISALLRLQDDAASAVPNHSPAVYRTKLTTWYQQQGQRLTELVSKMLYVDKGIYRLKFRSSGKYMAVDEGSLSENAIIEQQGAAPQAGADQWRVILDGTTHKFVNIRSGKCLALKNDSSAERVWMVQQTCSTSTTQRFNFAHEGGYYFLIDKYMKAVDVASGSMKDDGSIIHFTWYRTSQNQQWTFEPYGTGQHIPPTAVATAMYQLTARHSGKSISVDNANLNDGALIEQATYSGSNDAFHWYVLQNGTKYQLVNRHSSKCLALMTDSATSRMTQKTCNGAASTQLFDFNPAGDGTYLMFTKYGNAVEVERSSIGEGAYLTQGAATWNDNRKFALRPILAGEPHRLTFAYKTADATCGEYNFWYDIAKPNGQPLQSPQDTFVQLVFAGGKQTLTGKDVNPFIAQQVSGNRVSIDPTYGLNSSSSTSGGVCSAACLKYSPTSVAGACCSCNGQIRKYKRSAFNVSMYLCEG